MNPIFYLAGIVFAMITWYCVNETKKRKHKEKRFSDMPDDEKAKMGLVEDYLKRHKYDN